MTSIIRTTIGAAVGLLLLAGSPAIAARYDDAHHETRQEVMHQLSSRSDNSNPYFGLWLQGYPRSAS